jgi:uracil-DNA glycosylase family protein
MPSPSAPVSRTRAEPGAEQFIPAEGRHDLPALRTASAHCRGCGLYAAATQTVFGQGAAASRVMLVGEQPGDKEDRAGIPFVGPAGELLDTALADAGLDRSDMYVTNAVKHFKWEPRGKLRLHKNPSAREAAACRPWLMAEIAAVRPQLIVGLGAIAAKSLLGTQVRVTRDRGEALVGPDGCVVVVTVHPASIVRLRDHGARAIEFRKFVEDLRLVRRLGEESA